MINLFKKYFQFNLPSVILITIPYIGFYNREIFGNSFFSWINLMIFVFIILIFNIICIYFYNSSNKYLKTVSIYILCASLIFWYGSHLVSISNKFQLYFFDKIILRGRIILPLISLFFLLLQYFILRFKPSGFYIQNIFLTIFFLSTIFFNFNSSASRIDPDTFKASFVSINPKSKNNKPIVLIISDEYSSPNDLFKVYNDSSIYGFSSGLKNKGWIVNNIFNSNSTSTIHSLSSLFNFNISTDKRYNTIDFKSIGEKKLLKNTLHDSLKRKGIDIINLGILDFGQYKPINKLYIYPTNFSEVILQYSVFPEILRGTDNFSITALSANYYPVENHNQKILISLSDSLNKVSSLNYFIYVHLKMPHGPFMHNDEFEFKVDNLENYFDFWKFTNRKLDILLSELVNHNRYRVILTGDHGYRGDINLDPKNTFSAFYGFESADIEKLRYVQDLGSLINGYFK